MSKPLEGTLVVEFGQLIAAPIAGMLLSGHGAEVIKVEPPGGDPGRALQSGPVPGTRITPIAVAFNQGKRSIILDLKQSSARAAAIELIKKADVVLESSRPGAMERLGLGANDALTINPRVVYVSISAFGASGPERERGGVDIMIQAESGMMSVTGERGGPPLKVGFPIVDVVTGNVAAQAVLAALLQRTKTEKGEVIEVSLAEVALHLQAAPLTEYLITDIEPQRSGNSAPMTAPSDLFATADGHLVVTGYLEPHWRKLCSIVGMSELVDDERFNSKLNRVLNRDQLFSLLQDAFLRRSTEEWVSELNGAGLLAARVRTYPDVITSPQVLARESIRLIKTEDGTRLRAVRLPARFSSWDANPDLEPPAPGDHTTEILSEFGYSADSIAAMVSVGAAVQST